VTGLNNETAIFHNLLIFRKSAVYGLSPPTARKLLALYPNDPAHEPPYNLHNATIFPNQGLQWRRDCAIAGDLVMISGRRKVRCPSISYSLSLFMKKKFILHKT